MQKIMVTWKSCNSIGGSVNNPNACVRVGVGTLLKYPFKNLFKGFDNSVKNTYHAL